jgi:hypothetical protein
VYEVDLGTMFYGQTDSKVSSVVRGLAEIGRDEDTFHGWAE